MLYFTDTQALLINFVKDLHIKFPAEFQTVQGSLTSEQAVRLQACLEYTNGSSWSPVWKYITKENAMYMLHVMYCTYIVLNTI